MSLYASFLTVVLSLHGSSLQVYYVSETHVHDSISFQSEIEESVSVEIAPAISQNSNSPGQE